MMDDLRIVGLIVAVAALFASGAVLGAIAGRWEERQRRNRRSADGEGPSDQSAAIPPSVAAPALDDGRFSRLEQAVDAIALELERVSEGQRFLTKLFAERGRAETARSPVPGAVRHQSPPPTA